VGKNGNGCKSLGKAIQHRGKWPQIEVGVVQKKKGHAESGGSCKKKKRKKVNI